MAGRIITLLVALATALLGFLLVGIGLLRAIIGEQGPGEFWIGTAAVPGGIMLLELGIAATWLTLRAGRGEPSPAVTLPPWWLSAVAYVVAIGAGWLALRAGLWWLFLPFATVAIFAPIVIVGRLGLPGQGERPSWRRLLPAFAWGAIITPLLAITLQLLAAIGAFVAVVVGALASGQEHLEILQRVLQRLQGRTLTDAQAQALTQLAVQQPVVLAVGAFILVFVGPATEELCKFGAVLLFGRTRAGAAPLSTLTVFLIGLAAGLGFAATENIFYAAQGGANGWVALVLMRGVTPLMHGTASALFALGWARQRREPGGWGLLRGAALAIGLHAVWNFCAGLLIVALLFVQAGGTAAALASLLMLLAFGTMTLTILGSVLILLRLRRTLAQEAAQQEHPPAATPATPAGAGEAQRGGGAVAPPDERRQPRGDVLAPVASVGTDRYR